MGSKENHENLTKINALNYDLAEPIKFKMPVKLSLISVADKTKSRNNKKQRSGSRKTNRKYLSTSGYNLNHKDKGKKSE